MSFSSLTYFKTVRRIFLFFTFLCSAVSSFAQKDTEFWFAAPEVDSVKNPIYGLYDRPILLRMTATSTAASVTVSLPANPSFPAINLNIPANATSTVNLSQWINQIENETPNIVQNKGILIRSSTDITAYYEVQSFQCHCNPELFALKGKNALGNEFVVPSQLTWAIDTIRFPNARSAFDIVATEDGTTITINPRKALRGRPAAVPFTISLNRGQTFSCQGLYRNGPNLLNGSYITSDKAIAVTTKEDLLFSDGDCADLAGDQLVPTSVIGDEYAIVRGNLTVRDKAVVTAVSNGTNIYLNGNATPVATINFGQSYEVDLTVAASAYIKTSKKVYVIHYSGNTCEVGSAVIPKLNCTGSKSVSIVRSDADGGYVLIVTKSGNQGNFQVNGSSAAIVASDFLPLPGTAGAYVFCKKELSAYMPLNNAATFSNSTGKFQLGFLNGNAYYGGCLYGYFSDYKKSSVSKAQVEICFKDSAQLSAFGGGTYSWSPSVGLSNPNIANPKASPTANTIYKVTITDDEGCIDSAFVEVTLKPGSKLDFAYDNDACNPLSLRFYGSDSTQPITWNFGDGSPVVPGNSPVHIFPAFSNFIVTASKAGNCATSISKNIALNNANDNIIKNNDTIICPQAVVQLQAQNASSYCWSPSTYLNNSSIGNPTVSPLNDITYFLTAKSLGNNLIVNGDFNAGNTGFTSQYNFSNSNTTEGEYFVGTNPQAWNAALSTCKDHTTGTGNMMLVNGSPAADVNVWTQTIAIIPNTNYEFSTWIQALYPPNPAKLQFSINGTVLGNVITASLPTCTWTRFTTNWNSGLATTAVISIVNKNTAVQGNDFALDDIFFAPYTFKYDSVKIVIDKPVVKAGKDTSVCAMSNVQLNATGASTYSWAPSMGLSNATISNPIASINTKTTFTVTGKSANGCVAKDSLTVSILPTPVVKISKDTAICNLKPVQLTASGGLNYLWSPVSTLDNPLIANPIATPLTSTTYKVMVTGANGCSTSDSTRITVSSNPTVTIIPDTSICPGKSVQLNVAGGATYSWFPATGLSSSSISNPIASPVVGTKYLVSVKDSAGCESLDSVLVSLKPVPAIKVSNDTSICREGSAVLWATGAVGYQWSPAAGLNDALLPSPVANPFSSTQYTVAGIGINGCAATASVMVTVLPAPQIQITPDTAVCINGAVLLTASGGQSYQWSPTLGLNDPTIANPVASPNTATKYFVDVKDVNGCNARDSVSIAILQPNPMGVKSADISGCAGEWVQLEAFGGNTYEWTPVIGLSNAQVSNPTLQLKQDQQYQVKITESNCNIEGIYPVSIKVEPTLSINVSKSNDISCNTPTATLQTDLAGASYNWTPPVGLSANNIANPIASPVTTTIYNVTVQSFNGCTSKGSIEVKVLNNGDFRLFQLPNAFTPNNDGNNDCFGVNKWGNVSIEYFEIYNRWGQLVFNGKTGGLCWNGNLNGIKQPAGNYVYKIKVKSLCGPVEKKGNVILIR